MKFALALLASLALPAAATDVPRVGLDSFGTVRIGMTVDALGAALGVAVSVPTDPEEAACFEVDDPHHKGVSMMLAGGHVARVDVFEPGVQTVRGARVGDSAERVRALYGAQLVDSPHFYAGSSGGRYLTYWSGNHRFAVRFETESGKVARYYAGRLPEVEYVEGCQ